MNLREETIKVLRPFANVAENDIGVDEADADTFIPMSMQYARARILIVGDLRAAAALLSRLEAGSGEETGWQPIETAPKDGTPILISMLYADGDRFEHRVVWLPERRVWAVIVEGGKLIFFEADRPTHWHRLPPPPINQEGGDAADQDRSRRTGDRPHVATPAPGENSERATIVKQLRSAVTASGGVDASAELLLTAAVAIEVMARDWLADRKDSFAAGRRSMREEAANALSMRAQLTDDAMKRGALELCVEMVRAIPEKQS